MAGITWDPPGPGAWSMDKSHFNQPGTGFTRRAKATQGFDGMSVGFAMTGVAIGRGSRVALNGWPYSQLGWPDPSEYEQLELAAKDFLANKRWIERLQQWENVRRPERLAECRQLQAVDVTALDDTALLDHLDACLAAHQRASFIHFEQHSLCVLIGELILRCQAWGIDVIDVLPLLEGFSPASSRTAQRLQAVAAALKGAGVRPATLDDVRNASPQAAAALDAYLDEHGLQLVAGFDVDARTVVEMPGVVVSSILAVLDAPERATSEANGDAALERVRAQVPAGERDDFDEWLANARSVYGLRDDDVHFSMWGRGLTRRALLEAGRRLAERGLLHERDHVIETGPDEARDLLVGGSAEPSADKVAARVALRAEQAALDPPLQLGDPAPPPPLDAMPPTVRRLTEAMLTYHDLRRSLPVAEPLAGFGVGNTPYRGRAVVAANADDAFDRIEPGDVLVTVLTTPSYNAVLPLCGALVVEAAGILSHAAVAARELGVPAVVSLARATTLIPDGATVEVDPTTGRVRVLS